MLSIRFDQQFIRNICYSNEGYWQIRIKKIAKRWTNIDAHFGTLSIRKVNLKPVGVRNLAT